MTLGRRAAARGMTPTVLAILATLSALAPLSVDIYTPSLPLMQRELGGEAWLVQASVTACLLGIGVGQLVWGPLSDRVGRRPVILAGVIGWTVASVVSAVAWSPEVFVSVRAVAGLCGAAGIVVSRSVVRDLSSDMHLTSSRIGILTTVTSVAPIVAPVAGAAIATVAGWRADFVALAALGGVLTLAFALAVPESVPPAERTTGGGAAIVRGLGAALRDRQLVFVALSISAHAFGFYAYVATASFIVEEEFGYPPFVFALVFGTNAAAMLCANLVFRRVVRTRHPSLPLGIGLGASAVAGVVLFAAAAVGAPGWVLWVASTGLAAGTGFVLPGAHSWGQATVVASGAASALTGSVQFLGGAIGSPVTGLLGTTAANLGIVVALSSSVALVAWAAARRARRSAPAR